MLTATDSFVRQRSRLESVRYYLESGVLFAIYNSIEYI